MTASEKALVELSAYTDQRAATLIGCASRLYYGWEGVHPVTRKSVIKEMRESAELILSKIEAVETHCFPADKSEAA
ncbi:hypothetical protein UFOVP1349_22 [uncultured Caudovirales phage]|uniref:Uncharacterized protein n=1 Tax=uncultured Caudovirales phage TaxID=2100421 RepID=A0A6J5QHH3_9CAUD|nr:hypothetical protein UFOVP925_21 [uncultured Caudovirales phage]CAB4184120.1 hypothetical protein UFOVP1097_28 [uncultured Caudovirales phage]CAB4199983.1 hypothetical protein UFOVP1349_22 [uncultured Caudovirales phage]CAB4213895.1 hypothetical protein UFOVP1456_2 [uncultured Caudovirales phage]